MELEAKIQKLFEITHELEEMYPGRHFTPDGHMVGSLGEVYAAKRYGLKLFEASHPVHDALSIDGRLVQIKATQGSKIALSEEPDYLIVLKIKQDGSFREVYNGPGYCVWNACGKMQKTGQRQISLSKLCALDTAVLLEEKIKTLCAGSSD